MPETASGKTPEMAVLYERMTRVLDDYSELRGMVLSQNLAIQQVAIIHKDVATLNEKTERIFKGLSAQADITGSHSQTIQTHATIWKIVGAVMIACSGILGFGYSTLKSLEASDAAIDRRMLSVEYKMESFNASEKLKNSWNSDGRKR